MHKRTLKRSEQYDQYGIMQDTARSEYRWEGFQIMWSVKTVGAVRKFLGGNDSSEVNTAELEVGEE